MTPASRFTQSVVAATHRERDTTASHCRAPARQGARVARSASVARDAFDLRGSRRVRPSAVGRADAAPRRDLLLLAGDFFANQVFERVAPATGRGFRRSG